jgi:DNA-binding NarL/FixJ family response regulator
MSRSFVILVDPRPLTREWAAKWLRSTSRRWDVRTFDAVDAIASDRQASRSELAILNASMTNVADSWLINSIDMLQKLLPATPVVLITDATSVTAIRNTLALGVRGIITLSLCAPVVEAALQLVRAGGTFIPMEHSLVAPGLPLIPPESRTADGASMNGTDNLTEREMSVLRLIHQGKPNKIIAYELSITESTVKAHVHHLIRKLRASNRTEVALMAQRFLAAQEQS